MARTVEVIDTVDRQCRYYIRLTSVDDVRLINDDGACHRHGCAIVMPQGSSPTWMDLITFCAATSMTETSLETPLVTSRYFSSGVNAMCQTRWPTSRYFFTSWLVA